MEKFHLPNSDKCLIDKANCSGGGGACEDNNEKV